MIGSRSVRTSAFALSLASALAALSLGCSSPPDISGDLEEYGSLLNGAVLARCVCYSDLGYDDADACIDGVGLVNAADRDCLADVSSGNEEDVQAYLGCANQELETYVDCLELNDGCAEGSHDECTSSYESRVAGCPQLPTSIQASFSACTE